MDRASALDQMPPPTPAATHEILGGRVAGGDLYYDQASLLMQLGLMPQPSSA